MQREPDSTAGFGSDSSSESASGTISSTYEETSYFRTGSIETTIAEPAIIPTPRVVPEATADIPDEPSHLPPRYPVTTPPSSFLESSVPVGAPRCRVCRARREQVSLLKRTLFEMWFVCLMTLAALVIPLGLILAPYIGYYIPTIATAGSPTVTTPSPWANVPESCLAQVKLADDVHHLSTANSSPSGLSARMRRVFCLYNNSRFRKAQRWDYLPKHIPYELCPNIIYWSMGLQDGKVVSRAPEFDVRYGIWKIRATVQQHRPNARTNILMAIGGYPEDSAHFSRLGRDPGLMSKLAANILRTQLRHRLSGITIHWRDMQGECGSPDDFETLLELIKVLQRVYLINGLILKISIITPADKTSDLINKPELLQSLDLIFYETHRMDKDDVYRWCEYNRENVSDFYNFLVQHSHAQRFHWKICEVVSLGLPTSDYTSSQQAMTLVNAQPVSNISQVPGVAAVFEMCAAGVGTTFPHGDCDLRTYDIGLTTGSAHPPYTIKRVYAMESAQSLALRYAGRHVCALVVDIDFDLYRGTCLIPGILYHGQLWNLWRYI